MTAVAGVTLAALTLTAPAAGAVDWYIPAETTSILVPGYVAAVAPDGTVRGDSIHAVCDGPGYIEVGVHPFDEVPRNLQVWSSDGRLLVNVTSADHAELVAIADQPAELRYSGSDPYTLDLEACAPETPPPSSSVPTPETPPSTVGTTVPATPETTTVPGVADTTTSTTPTEVLASSIGPRTMDELPATGPSQRLIDLGITLVGFGLAILYAGRRTKQAHR